MRISSAFPSKYLKAEDLQGREVPVVVDHVQIEDVSGDNTESRPVCYFTGKTKGLVLNKTNAGTIALAYGDETDAWKGKEIILHPDTTMFQGKLVPCIRIRVPAPVTATEGGDEEPPF